MKKDKTLYLIDGSSYIFRAFFAIRQILSNSKGLPTNALYGFVNMLQKVIRDERPDYLAVVFDTKEKTFRHRIYSQYKANRTEPPDELVPQFPYFDPLVQAYDIVSLSKAGYEADDIIGTLARQGKEEGFKVTIVSGDKDMMQLIGPRIQMLDTMKNKVFGETDVAEKFGVGPDQVIEVMALMGDSSDNIPGVAGVGLKTAATLIQTFGSVDNLYKNIDQVDKKSLREKLVKDKDNALLSRRLVTIDTGVKLHCRVEDLQLKGVDHEKLRKIFRELEFTSLLNEFGGEPERQRESGAAPHRYQTILSERGFSKLLKQLPKEFAFDLETTSKYPTQAELVGISFAFKNHEAYYIPLAHRYLGVPDQLDKKHVLKKLKPILENPKVKKYGQNIKYEKIVLHYNGIELAGIDFDSMIASYVINPSKRNHNLDDLAMEYLQHKTIEYKEVAGTGAKEIGFDEVEIGKAAEYAAEDSDVTWLLSKKLKTLLADENFALFRDLEIPLIDTLAEMEINGVLLDKVFLEKLSKKIEKDLVRYEKEIYESAGEEFNINSPKQLAPILFEKLGLPVIKKTKTGYSTDVSVLEELAGYHELPEKILGYRQLAKLKSTYVDALPREINPKTGRVHTSFNQTVAATGRLSSSDPNLQNIPIRSDIGREIRKAFIVESKKEMLSADYSQIELRILAHLSADPALVKAFKKNEDVHARTAAEIFGTSLDRVDTSARRMAKAVNFGIVYGLSAFGLSRQLSISPKEAKAFIDQYFELYKNVKTFMNKTIENTRAWGYTKTLMNRKRYLPDINSKNKQVRSAAERVAINSPVQGSAADIIKGAMICIHQKLKKEKLGSKMILQVHDELVFECVPKEKKKMEALVVQEMEKVYPLKVPLVVDVGWGKNWDEAH
ncbi:MAG: DNA polymerase I [Nitrospinota bacterium]|nr:DNA polymerase I [Nitrospinota bacterium]